MALLQWTEVQRSQIEQQALAQYPQECCGLLLGITTSEAKQVVHIWPTENAWTPALEAEHQAALHSGSLNPDRNPEQVQGQAQEHDLGDRFWIDPRELLRAQKWSRSQNLNIIGIYHSHPDHPALPSERDRQSAWPAYSYIILSIVGTGVTPTVADCRNWILNDQGQFVPEALQVLPTNGDLSRENGTVGTVTDTGTTVR